MLFYGASCLNLVEILCPTYISPSLAEVAQNSVRGESSTLTSLHILIIN